MRFPATNRATNDHLDLSDIRLGFGTIRIASAARSALRLVALSAVVLIACQPALAQNEAPSPNTSPVAELHRPANVPEGYVITPFGYFHPSCVRSLAKGERQLADGRVQYADGSVEQNVTACSYPRYTAAGVLVNRAIATGGGKQAMNTVAPLAPEVNGWVENANATTGSATESYGALVAMWTVPPHPSANDGQVLFFFPGLEDIYNAESILQPVMEWYGGQWSIVSWNCCIKGVATNSQSVNVAPGDRIYGSITSTCSPGTLSCATWNVLSLDMTTGESTILADTLSEGQIFNWAFGGVLEPYSVVSCDDYPRDRRLSFKRITVFDENLDPVLKPKWSIAVNKTVLPQCNYDVTHEPRAVTLDY